MDEATNLELDTNLRFGDETISLCGPPPLCEGTVEVYNPGPRPVRLGRTVLQTHAPGLKHHALLAPDGSLTLPLRMFARIDPDELQRVEVELVVPHGTPPGTYTGTLIAPDGALRDVRIEVQEQMRSRAEPCVLQHHAAPGAIVRHQVLIENQGNVACSVALESPLVLYPARSMSPNMPQESYTPQPLEPAGTGTVTVISGAGELRPLESRTLELEILIPSTVPWGGRYQAAIQLGDAALRLELQVPRPA